MNNIKSFVWKIKIGIRTALGKQKEQAELKKIQNESELEQQNLDKKLVASLKPKGLPYLKQLKYISRVLSKKEKTIIQLLLLLIAVISLYWGYGFYTNKFQMVPMEGGEYTEGLIGAPRYINPLLAQTSDVDSDLTRIIFSGLLAYNNKLELVLDLAENYTVSVDQKTYVFTLKKNTYWHDKEPLTADDVVFTFHNAQDPQYKSPLYYSLRGVKIEKTNNRTIIFTLNEPYPQFLEVLTVGILPQHIWKDIPPMNANLTEYNIKPIGSGPWKYESYFKDKLGNIKTFTIVPNELYYGAKPFLKKITFKFYSNYDPVNDIHPAIEAINNRKIDGVSYIPKDLKNKIQNPNIRFYSFHLPQYTALFFNQKTNNMLKEKYIREAMAYAIDKTQILTEVLKLQGDIVDSPIMEGLLGNNENIKKIPYDPQKAMEILSENGWKEISQKEYSASLRLAMATSTPTTTNEKILENKDNSNKEPEQTIYRAKNKQILRIKITTPDITENMQASELIKKYLQNIGVAVLIEIIDDTKIIKEIIRPRNYEALLYGEIIGLDPDPYPFWHSSQNQDPGLNLAIFTNRNIDKALEDAKKAKTQEEKNSKYIEFQNLIIDEIPAIFLYSPSYTYAVHEKIKGVDIERVILPRDRYNNINEWYINTGRKWSGKQ